MAPAAPRFGEAQAIEFFKLYPDSIDSIHGPERKKAWTEMIKSLATLVKLMLKDPALEADPVAEGQRVGVLLWNTGVLEVARSRHQSHYSRTFENFAKVAQRAGRGSHAKFYATVSENLKDPDQDEWHMIEDNDYK